jgi:hypothetical protein
MGWTQAMVLGLAQIVRERLAVLTASPKTHPQRKTVPAAL